MTRIASLFFLGTFTLFLAVGCGEEKTPNAGLGAKLTVDVSDSAIDADGSEVVVTITAKNANGSAGEGTVKLEVDAGSLGGESNEITLTLDGEGKAETTYSCNISEDTGCVGLVSILGKWNLSTDSADVKLPGGAAPDGGTNMAGDYKIVQKAERSTVYVGVGDSTEVTVTLTKGSKASANQEIEISTTKGLLTGSGAAADTIVETTNSSGKVTFTLGDVDAKGSAVITARHTDSGAVVSTTVAIKEIQQIVYKSTTCSGKACTIMGKKGSGFNEVALMTFAVTDSGGVAVAGVPVTFDFSGNFPVNTMVSPTGTTDAKGLVTATVTSGETIGTFSLTATVIAGSVSADSPTFGVRGAKASNRGFTFSCALVNLGAWVPINPPSDIKTTCSFQLVDTFNNNVGTGTPVYFKSEGGSIANSAPSTAFVAGGANLNEGAGSVAFSTLGDLPIDTDPLPAVPGQIPYERVLEPSIEDGVGVIRNPRDGLLTIIAYLRGEEFYDDTNQNGTWDAGEQFYDMGEAFVDSNDNGVWDTGEILVDDSPADGVWNPPNGVWDSNTTVWVDTRVLITGPPKYARVDPEVFAGACMSGTEISNTAYRDINSWNPDRNLNRLPKGSVLSITDSSTKSVTSVINKPLLSDGYGFDILRDKVSAADGNSACVDGATPICLWKTRFGVKDGGGWDEGYAGSVRVAAPATNMTACQSDVATIGASGVGGMTTAQSIGGVK